MSFPPLTSAYGSSILKDNRIRVKIGNGRTEVERNSKRPDSLPVIPNVVYTDYDEVIRTVDKGIFLNPAAIFILSVFRLLSTLEINANQLSVSL